MNLPKLYDISLKKLSLILSLVFGIVVGPTFDAKAITQQAPIYVIVEIAGVRSFYQYTITSSGSVVFSAVASSVSLLYDWIAGSVVLEQGVTTPSMVQAAKNAAQLVAENAARHAAIVDATTAAAAAETEVALTVAASEGAAGLSAGYVLGVAAAGTAAIVAISWAGYGVAGVYNNTPTAQGGYSTAYSTNFCHLYSFFPFCWNGTSVGVTATNTMVSGQISLPKLCGFVVPPGTPTVQSNYQWNQSSGVTLKNFCDANYIRPGVMISSVMSMPGMGNYLSPVNCPCQYTAPN